MKTYRRIAAVTTATDILTLLADQKEPVSGPAIGRALSIPTGTIMCHLMTLVDSGFVEQCGEGYALGMETAKLWSRKKAALTGEINRMKYQLNELGGE